MWYLAGADLVVTVIYPPGLTRGMQVGLGLIVILVAAIGYRGFLRRHPNWFRASAAARPR